MNLAYSGSSKMEVIISDYNERTGKYYANGVRCAQMQNNDSKKLVKLPIISV